MNNLITFNNYPKTMESSEGYGYSSDYAYSTDSFATDDFNSENEVLDCDDFNYTNTTIMTVIKDSDESEEARKTVHGLTPFKRCKVTESMQRTTFMISDSVVAYKMFMGSVDIMDQKRDSSSEKRKGKTGQLIYLIIWSAWH